MVNFFPKNVSKFAYFHIEQNVTEVKIHMNIISMDLDENKKVIFFKKTFKIAIICLQELKTEMFLSTKWFDPRLNNNITLAPMTRIPLYMLQRIWSPRLFFRSAVKVEQANLPSSNSLLWLYQNKMIVYWAK